MYDIKSDLNYYILCSCDYILIKLHSYSLDPKKHKLREKQTLGTGKNTQFDVRKSKSTDVEETANCFKEGPYITAVSMILLKF